MPTFTEAAIRTRAQKATGAYRSAGSLLIDRMNKQVAVAVHDIFLSHAYNDKELVLGAALMLEDFGYSVYVDWRDDPSMNRQNVSPETAERLRARMKTSKCLFYSTTEHASESKWMPWELGYKDGHNGRAAILPVSRVQTWSYQGQEYLGVYPYITEDNDTTGKHRLWVRRSSTSYMNFDSWLAGYEPRERD
jgi:hypothetical protein